MKVLLTGGTGFVGTRIVHALRTEGRDVRALVRRPDRGAHLASLGVELAVGDVTDAASVSAAAEGCTHVVHLVAILKGRPHDFERVMTGGTRNVIAAAKNAGIERLVLMSALGTTSTTKDLVPYFGAKFAMEQDTVASGLEYTIFRPSFVFGHGGALATFMKQVRYSPVVTVIGSGRQQIQPIWIDDVAEHFARALDTPAAANKTFEIGGPDIVTWDELYRTIARVLGKRRALAHVPAGLARTGARATQWLPGAPLSADQVAMIEAGDNIVTNTDAVHTFQLPLVPLEDQIRRAA
ncbi:MAG TPA: complex I NDUFA9 subunit family protein [Gaiellaceae bacterium]